MAWETVVEHGLITVGIHVATRMKRVRFLKCRLSQPNADMRVAFSALLRVGAGGRYLLVRNLHRPELYGPFGGVYKYHETARGHLDSIQFKPQDLGPGTDMTDDLRGFLPRRCLPKITKWYMSGEARETPAACLYRELCEELFEVGVRLKVPSQMSLRRVRLVEEGPELVPGQRYTQFRIFEVYEPVLPDRSVENFVQRLFTVAASTPGLVIANSEEVLKGRTSADQLIGHHTAYLVSGMRIRGEDPPFASKVS